MKKLMINLLMSLITSVIWITEAESKTLICDRHPIYCQIKKNHPTIDRKYAFNLSNVIVRASRKYRIPAQLFTAILMQESRYKLDAKGCHTGLKAGENGIWIEDQVCADFGLSQIWYITARSYGFEIDKLLTDLEYSVNAGAQILSDFKKRYSHREVYWWTRYNSTNRVKRKLYRELVEQYL